MITNSQPFRLPSPSIWWPHSSRVGKFPALIFGLGRVAGQRHGIAIERIDVLERRGAKLELLWGLSCEATLE